MSLIKKLLAKLLHGSSGHHYGRGRPYHPHASSDHHPRPMGRGPHNQYGHTYYKKKKSSSFYSS